MSAAIALSAPAPGERVVALVNPHLRALDGIRFIAAFCVLAGHGYHYVVLHQAGTRETMGPISIVMRGLAPLGMTLFFVLSGFVIHYNYHRTVGIRANGNGDFFIARFCRLYPLFLAVFAIDFVHLLWIEGYLNGAPRNDFDLFGPLPFFLSFTQTWLFIPFDGNALFTHYGNLTSHAQATGAMWSLSVEFLFYLVYPLFSGWLTRRTGRPLALFASVVAASGIIYYGWTVSRSATVEAIGFDLYGSRELAAEFVDWVVFCAPFGRVSEFLLGAAAAQYFLSVRSRAPTLPAASTWIAAFAIMFFTAIDALVPWPLHAFNVSIIAAPIAGFVLLSVVQPGGASRLLASPALVKGGEASYSLYLLHYYTMHEWAAPWAASLGTLWRNLIFLAGMAVSIALARVVYLWFERPARSWLRGHFATLRLGVVLGWIFVAIALFSLIASLHVHAIGQIGS